VRRAALALAGVALALGGAPAGAHPFSVSYAQVAIADRSVSAIVRLPLDDVDLLLRLDRDLDGRVTPEEIQAAASVVSAYVLTHLHVAADEVALTPAVGALAIWRNASGLEYLQATATADAGRRIRVVSMRTDFLVELYPSHTTQAQISAAGRDERFVFGRGAAYERRIADEGWTAPALVAAGAAILGLLVMARRRRRGLALAAAMILASDPARADVIMTAAGLNTTLKTMERLEQQIAAGSGAPQADATFRLAAEADALASLMNAEVESHGMEQRELIDLALSRTKALGIVIAYNREKKKFFYDGALFRRYLSAAPRGPHAADAEFTLIAYQFYQSEGSDLPQLLSAVDTTQRFLARYPAFKGNAELRLYLAIDYRDLYRLYGDAHDAAAAERYRLRTRAEYQRIERLHRGTEQASSARQLLRRFDEETRQK